MRTWDIEVLYSFTLRPNMYLGETTPKHISLFLLGYEMGSTYECDFTSKLSNRLIEKYNLSKDKVLSGVLEELSIIDNNWIKLFQEIAKEILIQESDFNNKDAYLSIQREKLLGFLISIPQDIGFSWVINLYQQLRSVTEWEGNNFNSDILDLLNELKVNVEENMRNMNSHSFQLSKEMSELRDKLYDKLK